MRACSSLSLQQNTKGWGVPPLAGRTPVDVASERANLHSQRFWENNLCTAASSSSSSPVR